MITFQDNMNIASKAEDRIKYIQIGSSCVFDMVGKNLGF